MPNQVTIRIIEILRFRYQYTDDEHPSAVSGMIACFNKREMLFLQLLLGFPFLYWIDYGVGILLNGIV